MAARPISAKKLSGGSHPRLDEEWDFRVESRTLVLLPLALAVFTIVPALSIYEYLSTGTIDVSINGPDFPMWLLYSICWPAFLWLLYALAPTLKYYSNPEMFSLRDGAIEVRGHHVAFGDVLKITGRPMRADTLVETRLGNFTIHPHLARAAVSGLRYVFKESYDQNGFTNPAWFSKD